MIKLLLCLPLAYGLAGLLIGIFFSITDPHGVANSRPDCVRPEEATLVFTVLSILFWPALFRRGG